MFFTYIKAELHYNSSRVYRARGPALGAVPYRISSLGFRQPSCLLYQRTTDCGLWFNPISSINECWTPCANITVRLFQWIPWYFVGFLCAMFFWPAYFFFFGGVGINTKMPHVLCLVLPVTRPQCGKIGTCEHSPIDVISHLFKKKNIYIYFSNFFIFKTIK